MEHVEVSGEDFWGGRGATRRVGWAKCAGKKQNAFFNAKIIPDKFGSSFGGSIPELSCGHRNRRENICVSLERGGRFTGGQGRMMGSGGNLFFFGSVAAFVVGLCEAQYTGYPGFWQFGPEFPTFIQGDPVLSKVCSCPHLPALPSR